MSSEIPPLVLECSLAQNHLECLLPLDLSLGLIRMLNTSLRFGCTFEKSETEMNTLSYDTFIADAQRKRRFVDQIMSFGDNKI
jgi:hypothetical protein